MEVELQDVMKLVLQFLKEQGMNESLVTLQRESGVYLNTVTDLDGLSKDILSGRWELVVGQIVHLQVSVSTLQSLYEQVILELLEADERDLAREILRSAEPLQIMKEREKERFTTLERFCKESVFDEKVIYGKSSKEKRREHVAELVRGDLSQVESSRLLSLLQQSVLYQQERGNVPKEGKFDLFVGSRRSARNRSSEAVARVFNKVIKATADSKVTTAEIAQNATNMVLGRITGRLEIWTKESYEVRNDLSYQTAGEFLAETAPITSVCFSKDGDYLAEGTEIGEIKIWRISTGKCMRTFPLAHTAGISSLQFSKDGTQLLSTSHDHTARIHGLKSGKTLKEFRGHTSFVNGAVFLNEHVVTASSDGTVRFWDLITAECSFAVRPSTNSRDAVTSRPVHSVLKFLHLGSERIIVVSRGPFAFLLDNTGAILHSFTHGKLKEADFVCATLSPQSKWLYCAGEDHNLYVFDVESGQLEDTIVLETSSEVVKFSHHHQRNELVYVTMAGEIAIMSADD